MSCYVTGFEVPKRKSFSLRHFLAKLRSRVGPPVFMSRAVSYLSWKVVVAAEFMITSTSLAMNSAASSSNPRSVSHTFPTTGITLLNMKACLSVVGLDQDKYLVNIGSRPQHFLNENCDSFIRTTELRYARDEIY